MGAPILISLVSLLSLIYSCYSSFVNVPKVCDGNHFKFISTYALGQQNDLKLTFDQMEPMVHVEKVVYKDQSFRTYTISSLNVSFVYQSLKQIATVDNVHRLKISGAPLKISYAFAWEKKQLSSSIHGTGQGVVTTDPITFIKSLDINSTTKQLEWNYVSANPITITNSLTISKFNPYKAQDYDVINQMFNELKSGDRTVKDSLIEALNKNFTTILRKIVHENNDTWKEPQYVEYSYSDEHGDFTIGYDNFIISHSLEEGIELMLSQTAQNDSKFQCGVKVPNKPDDQTHFGGLQQFISNSFLKSTLRNALQKGFLDVKLSEEFWQSPAFQFFAGDLHEIMPSTKNIPSLTPITGQCKAKDDSVFSFTMKSMQTYDVKVNFTCFLEFPNRTLILELNLVVDYEIKPKLLTNSIDFVITTITGTPHYIQHEKFLIKNMDLANFMVAETLNMAKGAKVIGSGFRTMGRKFPGAAVRDSYLFLYDTALIPHQKPKQS